MTVDRFNSMSLKHRGRFIQKQLRGQKCGVFNTLVFKTKIIEFTVALYTGVCSKAEALELPDELREDAAALLGDNICVNTIWDESPTVKARIQLAIDRTSKRN